MVLGAAVGVVGTLGASGIAWFSMKSQLHVQQILDYEKWRRQSRRDAYAAFLVHLSKIRAPLAKCLDDLRQPSPDVENISRQLVEAESEASTDSHLLYAVMLEGPEKIAEIAAATIDAMDAMNNLMQEHCKQLLAGEDTSETEESVKHLGDGVGIYGAAFLAAARQEMKMTPASSSKAERNQSD